MSLPEIDAALRAADPERWAMTRLAPEAARARLVTLYALEGELARAERAASEPLLAEMRLAWWAEALARGSREAPLLAAVADAWGAGGLAGFVDGPRVMGRAAEVLGADAAAAPFVAAQARGVALLDELRRGAGAEVAREAAAAFREAAAGALPGAVAPALWPGADARRLLKAGLAGVRAAPQPEIARRWALARFAMTGNWRILLGG